MSQTPSWVSDTLPSPREGTNLEEWNGSVWVANSGDSLGMGWSDKGRVPPGDR